MKPKKIKPGPGVVVTVDIMILFAQPRKPKREVIAWAEPKTFQEFMAGNRGLLILLKEQRDPSCFRVRVVEEP